MRPVWLLGASQGFQALGISLFAVSLSLFAGASNDFRGLGLVLAAKTLPTIMVALFGGVVADRWRRKTVAIATLLGTALINICIALLVSHKGLGNEVFVFALGSGLIAAFGAPSLYALLPSLVTKDQNFRANAIVRTFRNGGLLLGPIAAGIMYHIFGPTSGIWLSGCFTIIAAGFITLIPLKAKAKTASASLGDVREAFTFAFRAPWFFVMLAFWGIFLAIQGGAAGVIQPIVVSQLKGETAWSTMATFMALGYIFGSVMATRWTIKTYLINGSILFVALSSTQLLSVTLSDNLALWVIASFVAGLGLEVSGVAWGSALQTRVDEENIGKVSSLDYAVSFGLVPVGYAFYGILGSAVEPRLLLGISALFMISIVTVAFALSVLYKFDLTWKDRRSSELNSSGG